MLKTMNDSRAESEKARFREILRKRYQIVKTLVQTHAKHPVLKALPFNSGYFMSFRCNGVPAETIRQALLKDHGLAGITGGLKNYFGAIHNPNKYHDSNCNPYIADLFEIDLIRKKHRLTILDALRVQYHRGPSYHPQWNDQSNKLVFGLDPVAVDTVGWKLVERFTGQKRPAFFAGGKAPASLSENS